MYHIVFYHSEKSKSTTISGNFSWVFSFLYSVPFIPTIKKDQLSLHQWYRITSRCDWVKSSVQCFLFCVIMKKTERKTQIRERKASSFSREKSYHISHWLSGFLYKQTWCDEIFQFYSAVRRRRKEKPARNHGVKCEQWKVKVEWKIPSLWIRVSKIHIVCLVDGWKIIICVFTYPSWQTIH